MNTTMKNFGYPGTSIKEFQQWVVLLRPKQVTLGSLLLICREEATAFSQISPKAFAELSKIIQEIETNLSRVFAYDKINYLMLMMVDPAVHFHVIPRYDAPRTFFEQQFLDQGWPGPPVLKNPNEIPQEVHNKILANLKNTWLSA